MSYHWDGTSAEESEVKYSVPRITRRRRSGIVYGLLDVNVEAEIKYSNTSEGGRCCSVIVSSASDEVEED